MTFVDPLKKTDSRFIEFGKEYTVVVMPTGSVNGTFPVSIKSNFESRIEMCVTWPINLAMPLTVAQNIFVAITEGLIPEIPILSMKATYGQSYNIILPNNDNNDKSISEFMMPIVIEANITGTLFELYEVVNKLYNNGEITLEDTQDLIEAFVSLFVPVDCTNLVPVFRKLKDPLRVQDVKLQEGDIFLITTIGDVFYESGVNGSIFYGSADITLPTFNQKVDFTIDN